MIRQSLELVPPRVRWTESREDKRHRRMCFSCGERHNKGWELRRAKDHGAKGVVVCDYCYESWINGMIETEDR